jgi:hypothetical protein
MVTMLYYSIRILLRNIILIDDYRLKVWGLTSQLRKTKIYPQKVAHTCNFSGVFSYMFINETNMATQYKIEFHVPHNPKNWTEDLNLIKEYSKILEKDSLHLYNGAKIQVKEDGKEIVSYNLNDFLTNHIN